MQGVHSEAFVDGAAGGAQRLRRNLSAEHPLHRGVRLATAVEVLFKLLELEEVEQGRHSVRHPPIMPFATPYVRASGRPGGR